MDTIILSQIPIEKIFIFQIIPNIRNFYYILQAHLSFFYLHLLFQEKKKLGNLSNNNLI